MNNKKGFKIFAVIFILLGLVFFSIGIFIIKGSYELKSNGINASGVVTDFRISRDDDGTTYYPIVDYITKEGKKVKFEHSVGSSNPSLDTGDKVKVIYNPNDPKDASIDSFSDLFLFPSIFVIAGLIPILVVVLIGIYYRKKEKLKQRLLSTGRSLNLSNARVVHNTGYKVNGRSPFQIIVQYEENGKMYIYKSENIWFDPNKYVTKDTTITVYVDSTNLKKHYMDISFLPKLND